MAIPRLTSKTIVLALVTFSLPVSGMESVHLLEYCHSEERGDLERCLGFLSRPIAGLAGRRNELKQIGESLDRGREKPMVFNSESYWDSVCFPTQVDLKLIGMARSVLLEWAERHPDATTMPLMDMLESAFVEEWPCDQPFANPLKPIYDTTAPQAVEYKNLVEKATREWLELVDETRVDAAWDLLADKMKRNTEESRWKSGISRQRSQHGSLLFRSLLDVGYTNWNGVNRLRVRFRSSFDATREAIEEVLLESDGERWRVFVYGIVPDG